MRELTMRMRTRRRNSAPDAVFGSMMRNRAPIALLALTIAVIAVAAAAGQPRASRSIVLGKTTNYPQSGCPDTKKCQVIARVTGIQMQADGTSHPFRAPSNGQLVAWWLKLPAMHQSQVRSFSQLFGGAPAARIAVLRRGKRSRVRLVRQSPTQELQPLLGTKGRVRLKLAQPLRVKQGDYIGLTAVTWVPAFAVNLDPIGDVWLASRPTRRCKTPSSSDPNTFARYYKQNDAQLLSSTVKLYQCSYQTARLLYWARMVPDPPQPKQGGSGTQQPSG
jgi:hypothetical protein